MAKKTVSKKKMNNLRKIFVIVESPAEGENELKSVLGKNYRVVASVGHIRDLKN